MRIKFAMAAACLAVCFAGAAPVRADDQAAAQFKAEIDTFLQKLEADTQGILRWDGADRLEVKPAGETAVLEIVNARLTIQAQDAQPARVSFDHIEIRRAPGPDGSVAYAAVFPAETVLHAAKGEETRLALKDGRANVLVDAQS